MFFEINAEDLQKKIRQCPWLEQVYDKLRQVIRPLMEQSRPYDLAKGAGRCAARAYGFYLTGLYTVGIIENSQAYIDKAVDMFRYAIEHAGFEYYETLNHHLSVGDAAMAYAVSYDLLEPWLTEEDKDRCKAVLKDMGEYLYGANITWTLPHRGVRSCNHNCVHHSGLGLIGMILGREDWTQCAVEHCRAYVSEGFDETGFTPEGVSYSAFGMMYAIVLAEAYKNVTGIDFLTEIPHVSQMPNQYIEQMLPGNHGVIPLGDQVPGRNGNSAPLVYLACRYGYSDVLYVWQNYEQARGTFGCGHEDPNAPYREVMAFPFLFMWANDKLPLKRPSDIRRPLSKKFQCGRAFMRTAWDDEMAAVVSFISGYSYHRGHNQPDQNSFTLYALGENFLIDPGRRCRDSRSHNLVMADGFGQLEGVSRGEITRFEDRGRYVRITGDATEAYVWVKQMLIGYAVRHMTFIRYPHPMLIIRDDIQDEKNREKLFEFMLHTAPENEFYQKEGSVYIRGARYGHICRISMVYPKKTEIQVSDLTERMDTVPENTVCASQYQKEISISAKAVNPFFTAVITFGKTEQELPEICSRAEGTEIWIDSVFPDGYKETIKVERYGMELAT